MKKLDINSFESILEQTISRTKTIKSTEVVMIDSAHGRVLASDIICRKNLPSFNNSAMDGFAFRHIDAGKRLNIATAIFAGDTPDPALREGECYRIMTGAKVPDDADTIVPIEECSEVTDESVVIPKDIKKGNALRLKGEEQKRGSVLIQAGQKLEFSHIAMLSAQGVVALKVFRKLKIAVLSTGDEIREPWQEASEDEIYNANAFGITALLRQYGFDPVYAGSIPDDLHLSKKRISDLVEYDAIITTGGISMGDADFLKEAFEANGLEKFFHGVNVKPGRPTMMGKIGKTLVMAMPGNPMTTLLNIFLLSIPILRRLQGQIDPHHKRLKLKISQSLKLKSNRTNLVLGSIKDGTFKVTGDNKVGSGMLTPLMQSDAVAIFAEGIGSVEEGDEVSVVLF